MGKSGNTKGYKVFSINTTVRNPCRDIRFLEAFYEFNGMDFDSIWKMYYKKLISLGIYRPKKIPPAIETELDNGEELTDNQVNLIIELNKGRKLNERGRVGTQLRALKDQGFLKISSSSRTINKVFITDLGFGLLNGSSNPEDVYCKAMIGLHANNPSRKSMYNKSRPFLNTLYVIKGVTDAWKEKGNKELGITDYEFGAFVLPMKDCDYQKAIDNIIDFREKHGHFIKKDKDFKSLVRLTKQLYKPVNISTKHQKDIEKGIELIRHEYPDEVFRKFKMTNLLEETKNSGGFIFYYFNESNYVKVESIFEEHVVPAFSKFKSVDEYNEYLYKIVLPWQKDTKTRIRIAKKKARQLSVHGTGIFTEDNYINNLKTIEERLESIASINGFEKAVNSSNEETIINELKILSGSSNSKSKYSDIDEPLRLEFAVAVLFALKYGKDKVKSYAKFDGAGMPLYHAPGGKPDVVFNDGDIDLAFIMEPTMLSNQTEIMKRESVGVWDHYQTIKSEISYLNYGLLISPVLFRRITCFFKFCAKEEKTNVIPISIASLIRVVSNCNTLDLFSKWLSKALRYLTKKSSAEFVTKINDDPVALLE